MENSSERRIWLLVQGLYEISKSNQDINFERNYYIESNDNYYHVSYYHYKYGRIIFKIEVQYNIIKSVSNYEIDSYEQNKSFIISTFIEFVRDFKLNQLI